MHLMSKYKDRIYERNKNVDDIISFLKDNFSVNEIADNLSKYEKHIKNFKLNCINSIKNTTHQYTGEDLHVIIYEINIDENSEIYYRHCNLPKEKKIYVMIETKTGYIDSNCSLLHKKLLIYEGISKFDIDNTSPKLLFYLRMIDEFESEAPISFFIVQHT